MWLFRRPYPNYVKTTPQKKSSTCSIPHPTKEPFAPNDLPCGEIRLLDKANTNSNLLDETFHYIDVMPLETSPFDACSLNRPISEFLVTEPEKHSVHCKNQYVVFAWRKTGPWFHFTTRRSDWTELLDTWRRRQYLRIIRKSWNLQLTV